MELFLAGLVGAIFGSFVTLVSYRLPRGEDIVFKPSRCPKCETKLGIRDLFPLLSWMVHRARCSHCKHPVSIRYPLTELSLGLLFALLYAMFGLSLEGILLMALAVCLMIMIVVDFEFQIIPDEMQIAMLILGFVYRLTQNIPAEKIFIGMAVGLGIGLSLRYGYYLVKKQEGLGMGDVKFLAVAGVWIGASAMLPFLFLGGVIGVLTAIVWRVLKKGPEFPFGPALAASMFVCIVAPLFPYCFWRLTECLL